MELKENNYDFSSMRKQVNFTDRNKVVSSFKPNNIGDAIVVVGRPVQSKADGITYHDKKEMSYEDYLVYKYKGMMKK